MGSIKDRNGMDLTEAEDIKKRWQEYTEGLYKKDLPNILNEATITLILKSEEKKRTIRKYINIILANKI